VLTINIKDKMNDKENTTRDDEKFVLIRPPVTRSLVKSGLESDAAAMRK